MADTLNVTSYKDNPNGTTTNTLSDGSTDIGSYSKNSDGSLTFSPLVTGTVPAETLQSQPTLNIPPASQDNTNYNAIINGTFSSADQQQLTQANNTQTAGVSSLAKLYADVGLKANDTAQMEQSRGIEGMQTDVQNLTNTLNGLQAEANIIPLQAQKDAIGKGMTDRGLAPITTAQLRDIAIKTLTTSSLLQAKQGDLTLANSQIEKAISLKYAPKEAEIAAKEKLLTLNQQYFITPLETKRAAAQTARLEKEKQDLADRKAKEIKMSDMIINATPYAPASITANARKLMEAGKSPAEIAIALGKYGGDYLGDLVKRSTIDKNNKDIEKTAAEIKALQTPIPVVAPAGSNAYSAATWMNSAVNKESLSAGEREKISKSFAVTQQLGNLARSLQKDQTSFFGGKVREIMAAVGQDADAGAIQAQITALVPQVARGTYGEVGVLTNADVKNYRQVIGNLSSPNDQNKAVTSMTLVALRNGVKSQLDTAAASKLDVSRFVPMYQDLTNQINTINDDIGVTDIHVKNYADQNPQVKPMVEQLIKDGRKGSEILQILGVEY